MSLSSPVSVCDNYIIFTITSRHLCHKYNFDYFAITNNILSCNVYINIYQQWAINGMYFNFVISLVNVKQARVLMHASLQR